MSTKIHHGYRIDLAACGDLFALVTSTRTALEASYRKRYEALVVRLAVGQIDATRRGLSTERRRSGFPLMDAMIHIQALADEVATTHQRNPRYDLSCEITFLSDPTDPSHLLALLYCEQEAYKATFASQPGVEHWPYWNNSDRPDDVSEAEWALRAETWDRALGYQVPAQAGLTWSLLGSQHHHFVPCDQAGVEAAGLVELVPSRSVRARNVAALLPRDGQLRFSELMDAVRDDAVSLEPSLDDITAADLCQELPSDS